jgi:uncharacterized protein YlxW (UPF0749 family)
MDRSPDELRAELASLETAEAKLSAERRHVHNQIDYGYATDETHAREREVSDERRQLHERIDAIRELLGESEPAASEPSLNPFGQWSGISPEVAAAEADD